MRPLSKEEIQKSIETNWIEYTPAQSDTITYAETARLFVETLLSGDRTKVLEALNEGVSADSLLTSEEKKAAIEFNNQFTQEEIVFNFKEPTTRYINTSLLDQFKNTNHFYTKNETVTYYKHDQLIGALVDNTSNNELPEAYRKLWVVFDKDQSGKPVVVSSGGLQEDYEASRIWHLEKTV